jgi:hypothetical protein
MFKFAYKIAFSLFFLAATASAALPFVFWLQEPKRTNSHDPKSASFMPASTPVPVPTPTPLYLWQDFETDVSAGFWYPAGPSPMTQSWASDDAHGGAHSWKMVTGAGVGYGHWTGLDMLSPKDFTGATKVSVWVKCDQNLQTEFHFIEGMTNGGDGETWWSLLTITGSPSWQHYTLPLSGFFSTGGPHDGVLSVGSVQTVWFYHWAPYPALTLYVDDIGFQP